MNNLLFLFYISDLIYTFYCADVIVTANDTNLEFKGMSHKLVQEQGSAHKNESYKSLGIHLLHLSVITT